MTRREGRMSSLVHQGGWAKREVEAARDVDEDADDDIGVAHDASWGPGSCMARRQSSMYLQ
jgi:hypothetical protein